MRLTRLCASVAAAVPVAPVPTAAPAAASRPVPVSVTVTTSPGDLPRTGADLLAFVSAALVLLAVGLLAGWAERANERSDAR